MNWRRGLLRLYLILSFLWAAMVLRTSYLTWEYGQEQLGGETLPLTFWIKSIAPATFPFVLLAIGWALWWLVKGFQKPRAP